jgi:hypothetical protein
MKAAILFAFVAMAACHGNTNRDVVTHDSATDVKISPEEKKVSPKDSLPIIPGHTTSTTTSGSYSNKRFKEVKVKKLDDTTFVIKGKAQVFEAAFAWVIEDGHEELKQGFAMTDAGAPEWGNFSITVNAKKKRSNSVLHLILFESSAKDGTRQFQLPVLLN